MPRLPYAQELRRVVDDAAPRLLALGDRSGDRRLPSKWSAREIIGHLVDSASNNHQRFVRARFQEDLVFAGYAQDEWVQAGGYQDAPWDELVTLWRTFNLQIARVMERVPDDVRLRARLPHNLHQIGFVSVPEHRPATLDHLMRDYIVHLEHHLTQIFAASSRNP
jgi:hypothetical protein